MPSNSKRLCLTALQGPRFHQITAGQCLTTVPQLGSWLLTSQKQTPARSGQKLVCVSSPWILRSHATYIPLVLSVLRLSWGEFFLEGTMLLVPSDATIGHTVRSRAGATGTFSNNGCRQFTVHEWWPGTHRPQRSSPKRHQVCKA